MRKLPSLILKLCKDPVYITHMRLTQNLSLALENFDLAGKFVLDVGCGDRPYQSLFAKARYVGIDIADSGRDKSLKRPDIFYDGKVIPFDDGEVDIVLFTQVLEHVAGSSKILSEISRVLRSRGKLILTVPFVYPEHEMPHDFYRYTNMGISAVLLDHNFLVEYSIKDSGPFQTLAVLLNLTLLDLVGSLKSRNVLRLLRYFLFMPIQLLALILDKVIPSNKGLYLNNLVIARRM